MRRAIQALLVVLAAGAVTAAMVAGAGAQAPAAGAAPATPPPPLQNLQIFPKDIPRPELIAAMRGFTTALGVECNYCHVQEGRGGRNDMAADDKPTKKTARVMLTLVMDINTKLDAALGPKPNRVQCATCHRGSAIPKVEPPPAPAAAPTAAAPAPGA